MVFQRLPITVNVGLVGLVGLVAVGGRWRRWRWVTLGLVPAQDIDLCVDFVRSSAGMVC